MATIGCHFIIHGQQIGAYYFDGWTGTYPYHITQSLKDSFTEREPIWGWVTSTQEIVDTQIKLAEETGLSFFSFCWYYSGERKYKTEPLNHALNCYINSKERKKLKYCLLIANHKGFEIGPKDWPIVTNEWITDFKSKSYLKVNKWPLIIFLSPSSLVAQFGSPEGVKMAFNALKLKAKSNGLKGVTIAACIAPEKDKIILAENCGFDMLTGYNYYGAGFTYKNQQIPIENLQKAEYEIWDKFSQLTKLKYIPVTTLNWDPRPWANRSNNYSTRPYYVGFSPESIYQSVLQCEEWIHHNPEKITKEKLAILYAWNEYGEGAYLTPTKNGIKLLDGVRRAMKKKK